MLIILKSILIALVIVSMLLLIGDWLYRGYFSWIAGQVRYLLYWHWVHNKKYQWNIMHEFGGGYLTAPMNRKQVLKHLGQSGETVKGVDDQYKIIYCRVK